MAVRRKPKGKAKKKAKKVTSALDKLREIERTGFGRMYAELYEKQAKRAGKGVLSEEEAKRLVEIVWRKMTLGEK